MESKIYQVAGASFHILKTNPPRLLVQANGLVNSSGWSNGRLLPWAYVNRPADGIIDFDFVATAPTGVVLWVISAVSGSGVVPMYDWINGFRIHSASNKVEVMLNEEGKAVPASVLLPDRHSWPDVAAEAESTATFGAALIASEGVAPVTRLNLESLDEILSSGPSGAVYGPKDQAGH